MRALLAASIGMLVCTLPQAIGQAADGLAAELAKGVTCASPDASDGLLTAIAKATSPAADILAALDVIGSDAATCEPVRNAAKELAVSLSASAAVPEAQTAAASNAVLAEVAAEAERRAASLKFEVGPPPPNLTRGRSPGL